MNVCVSASIGCIVPISTLSAYTDLLAVITNAIPRSTQYQSFSERVSNLKINVIHRVGKQAAEPDVCNGTAS